MAWGNPLPVVGNWLWVAIIVYSGRWRAWVGSLADRLLSAVWLPHDRVARFLTLPVENLEPIHSSGKHSMWWAFS